MHHDDVHLVANQFGREAREPFPLVLGESAFKDNVLAFDITEFTQARAEAPERVRVDAFGSGAEKPDPVDLPRLLRLDRERNMSETDHENDRKPDHRMGTSV